MLKKLAYILVSFLIISCSCSEEEVKLSRIDIYKRVRKVDPKMELIMPKSINDGVHCSEYTPGCLSGHRVLLNNLEVTFVQFQSNAHAKRAAYKFKGFVLNNWLLDDFIGEPSLERIAENELGATKITEYIKPYPEEIKKPESTEQSKSH